MNRKGWHSHSEIIKLRIRPVFHWTDKRIESHIAMCFIAYTFLNNIRLATSLTEKQIVRTLDKMQFSEVEDKTKTENFYLRSNLSENQKKILETLKITPPNNTSNKNIVNQMFM